MRKYNHITDSRRLMRERSRPVARIDGTAFACEVVGLWSLPVHKRRSTTRLAKKASSWFVSKICLRTNDSSRDVGETQTWLSSQRWSSGYGLHGR